VRQFNITVQHEDGSTTQHLNVPEAGVPGALAVTVAAPDVIGYSVTLAEAKARPKVQPLARSVSLSGSTYVPDVVVLLVLAYAHLRRERYQRDQATAAVWPAGHELREWFNRGELRDWFDTFPVPRDLVDNPSRRGGRLGAHLVAMGRAGLLLPPSGDVGWRLP